jgi:hypothetical protein
MDSFVLFVFVVNPSVAAEAAPWYYHTTFALCARITGTQIGENPREPEDADPERSASISVHLRPGLLAAKYRRARQAARHTIRGPVARATGPP